MEIRYTYQQGAFAKAFDDKYAVMARAATAAMIQFSLDAKNAARASVASAGPTFAKWKNAVRSQVYPKSGVSASPAAVVWVRSEYAGIFETGGTIAGKPLLWVPITAVWKKIGIKPQPPSKFTDVVSIPHPGKPPLLGIRIKGTSSRLAKGLTISQLRRGTKSKRGIIRTVPLWVGVPRVTIGKKWSIREAVESAAKDLERLYFANLRDE